MKTITRTQRLTIDTSRPFTYVKGPEREFVILTKDVPEKESALWSFKKYDRCFHFWSDEYLANYHEGNWSDYPENEFKDKSMKEKWLAKDFTNLYMGHAGDDGFIYKADGDPLVRNIKCEFWESYYPDLRGLEKELRGRTEWSNFDCQTVPHYSRDSCGSFNLHASYLPTQKELNKWFARKVKYPTADLGHSYGVIHDFKYIKKYYKNTAS